MKKAAFISVLAASILLTGCEIIKKPPVDDTVVTEEIIQDSEPEETEEYPAIENELIGLINSSYSDTEAEDDEDENKKAVRSACAKYNELCNSENINKLDLSGSYTVKTNSDMYAEITIQYSDQMAYFHKLQAAVSVTCEEQKENRRAGLTLSGCYKDYDTDFCVSKIDTAFIIEQAGDDLKLYIPEIKSVFIYKDRSFESELSRMISSAFVSPNSIIKEAVGLALHKDENISEIKAESSENGTEYSVYERNKEYLNYQNDAIFKTDNSGNLLSASGTFGQESSDTASQCLYETNIEIFNRSTDDDLIDPGDVSEYSVFDNEEEFEEKMISLHGKEYYDAVKIVLGYNK